MDDRPGPGHREGGRGLSADDARENAAVRIRDLRLDRGGRTLVSGLDLDVARGEFLAVLGPNGAGKSSLLAALTGELTPVQGSIEIGARTPGDRSCRVGYVPQQRGFDPGIVLRARDLVGLGVDGTRWGPGWPSRSRSAAVAAALRTVGAEHLADRPVGRLSGGQQQRVRAAQALARDPELLLCDEPLLSLDLTGQEAVASALDDRRRSAGTPILFVTHEINPVLPYVDRVLYLVDGRHRVGTPDEVLTTEVLSELYASPVLVLRVEGQIVVVGQHHRAPTEPVAHDHHLEEL